MGTGGFGAGGAGFATGGDAGAPALGGAGGVDAPPAASGLELSGDLGALVDSSAMDPGTIVLRTAGLQAQNYKP